MGEEVEVGGKTMSAGELDMLGFFYPYGWTVIPHVDIGFKQIFICPRGSLCSFCNHTMARGKGRGLCRIERRPEVRTQLRQYCVF